MVGVPYVASGPLAHSLSLDKVVTKMILRQHGLPTPEFAVLDSPDAPVPELPYPLIVKPKSEAVSFGLKVVANEAELREAAGVIFEEFRQPILVEQYVEGREINVGLLGNSPPEALPPVELVFPGDGPGIYTYEDKTGTSGRTVSHRCPPAVDAPILEKARELAVHAFKVLGCCDCARVDMRLDAADQLYILEVNSLPSLGEHGSYLVGAEHIGLDFPALVNRLVDEASARYFGTPEPPSFETGAMDTGTQIFTFITQRRDAVERRLKEWTNVSSQTSDPIGIQEAARRVDRTLNELGMSSGENPADGGVAWMWETKARMDGGTLFVGHLDVPSTETVLSQMFRREPEWLYGEGIGSSRAPLVMLEFSLRALRSLRRLHREKIGVLLYADEGHDALGSAAAIRSAAARAGRVFVLRPGNPGGFVVTQRRGQRIYRFHAEGEPCRSGRASKKPEVLRWLWNQLEGLCGLSDRKARISVSVLDIRAEGLPMLLPHRVNTKLLVTYPDSAVADEIEQRMRAIVAKEGPRWELKRISDRPAMTERRSTLDLVKSLGAVANRWEIPLRKESSVWPSVAGLVPASIPCLCGIGPTAQGLGTPDEAVQRMSLVQRSLLLAEFLATNSHE
jgi:D-alanine-D-alanine ligase